MSPASAICALYDCGTVRAKGRATGRFEALVKSGMAVRLRGGTIITDHNGYGDYRLTKAGKAVVREARKVAA